VTVELTAAYAHCRAIAKREAKNFYYGFMALPSHKRDAMCAVYAFMRRADDISDDESLSLDERRALMQQWNASWRGRAPVEPQDAPVFEAVRDVQQRYGVSDDLLAQLVEGTTMDLDPEPPSGVCRVSMDGRSLDQYENVEALERYCYLVASVVGLTTIRIFGFRDLKANEYAEQLGLAFQLTNILRDVKEDAERGRVYLPLDLLEKHGVSTKDVLAASAARKASDPLKSVLRELGARAENYYGAEKRLIPLLDADSRAAMGVLIDIYHLLLKQIAADQFEVFGDRISVSTPRKLAVLARGMLGGMLARGGGASS
jgi:phytoene synthase